jgi:hypothetical protein
MSHSEGSAATRRILVAYEQVPKLDSYTRKILRSPRLPQNDSWANLSRS